MKATETEQAQLKKRFPNAATVSTKQPTKPRVLVNDAPKNKNGVLVNKPFKKGD